MNRYVLPGLGFLCLIAVFAIGLTLNPRELDSPLVGRMAPEFDLPELLDSEKVVSNTRYAGQYYLLNVWASWCFACRHEHDFLLDLKRRNVLPIIGLNWRDRRVDALRWINELGSPYSEIAFDLEGRIGIEYGVYGAPETYLIGPDGMILHKHISPLTEEIWAAEFAPRMEQVQ